MKRPGKSPGALRAPRLMHISFVIFNRNHTKIPAAPSRAPARWTEYQNARRNARTPAERKPPRTPRQNATRTSGDRVERQGPAERQGAERRGAEHRKQNARTPGWTRTPAERHKNAVLTLLRGSERCPDRMHSPQHHQRKGNVRELHFDVVCIAGSDLQLSIGGFHLGALAQGKPTIPLKRHQFPNCPTAGNTVPPITSPTCPSRGNTAAHPHRSHHQIPNSLIEHSHSQFPTIPDSLMGMSRTSPNRITDTHRACLVT